MTEQNNPFAKPTEPVAEPAATEPQVQEPEVKVEETPVIDPVKERYGIALDELEGVIQKANQYSWVEEDSFAKTVLEKYREGKSLNDIAQVLGKDWTKASDLDIIREDLARQGITETDLQDYQIGKLFGEFDEGDDSPEAKLTRKQLAKKASELRAQYQEEQKAFGSPTNYQEKEMAEFEKQIAEWQKFIDNDPATKSIVENKRLTFEYDGRQQNLEVDANALVEMTKHPGKFIERLGEMDLETQYKVAAFLQDPNQFIKQVAEIGKLSAKEALLKEERNPEPQPHVEPDLQRKFTDKPISEWTSEEKLKFLREAQIKR